MTYTINTDLKQVTIEKATGKELLELIKKYKDYNFITKEVYINGSQITFPYPIYTEPFSSEITC